MLCSLDYVQVTVDLGLVLIKLFCFAIFSQYAQLVCIMVSIY